MNNNDNFYLIIPLGFEQLAATELLEKWSAVSSGTNAPNFELGKGGIELNCSLEQGFLLNHYLKIPTRILLRVNSFKCRDFPKLFKKLQKLEWNRFLAGQPVEVKSSAINSRVFDSRRIEKTVKDALNKYFIANAPKKKHVELAASAPTPILFLRFEDDICTVSIDTSGEKLYRRSYRKYIGEAPIRENIATGLLLKLREHIPSTEDYNLIDPMCGSATFLLESSMYNVPSIGRPFSWQFFPASGQPAGPEKSKTATPLFDSHLGFDQDEKVLEAAQVNIALANQNIQTQHMDLFSTDLPGGDRNVVIINPPYGKRIAIDNLDQFFEKIVEQIAQKFNPELIGIIIPEEVRFKHSKTIDKLRFKNGGLNVCFYILKLV